MRLAPPSLMIVIPCYNEEKVLPRTFPLFRNQLEGMISAGLVDAESKMLFVNDGSNDKTWEILSGLCESDECVCAISLSCNRGHQNALLAGLMEAKDHCDIAISIDCDGQDDISVMSDMVREYLSGSDVVYGVRSSRETDTVFKRMTAECFYRLLCAMGVKAVFNHADYRLMSSRALEGLASFKEVNLFLRGMVPLVGYKSSSVYYERHERIAGESHYPIGKMLSLAIDGITSLSVKPIRLITVLGMLTSVVSFVFVIWAFTIGIVGGGVSGWASTLSVVCFMGGVQLVALGVIGEYVGKIYLETKHRPNYIIAEKIGLINTGEINE